MHDWHDESCHHSLSPAASINNHGKRSCLPDSDAVTDVTANFVKAQKVKEGSGRPKASDYDEVTKEVILTATGIYSCLVSMSNAFPTPQKKRSLSSWLGIVQMWRLLKKFLLLFPLALQKL